jgi:2,3,4,5-tetrahydropyridine-2-carboxylate N-succinyltransferase
MTASLARIEEEIERFAATQQDAPVPPDADRAIEAVLDALERGDLRAAQRGADGRWEAVAWVKRAILLAFRLSSVIEMPMSTTFGYTDKEAMPPRRFALDDGVRLVPGGSAVRRGAFLARGVVCMPPMYVNVGAWVGAGTMIDSHALVGSCAQIGERVHLSAAAQIGGVLEPVNASPVVVEDGAMIGGNCGVYEGTVVREGAVLGAGVILTRGTPVYDLVNETIHRGSADRPLEIPPNAVVVPGARRASGAWAGGQGLSLQAPVIVKYRDERTNLATTLEQWLR